MKIQLKSSMTCVASVIFFACSTPALADTGPVVVTGPSYDERPSLVVKYGDLDLATDRDQKRLNRRVDSAIEEVCGFNETYAVRTLSARVLYQACSTEAWTRARDQMATAVSLAQSPDRGGTKVADRTITVSVGASQ